jgi:hypothetical protein
VIDTAPPPPTITCPHEGTGPATLAGTTFYIATQAWKDANNAYNHLAGLSGVVEAQQLSGLTVYPGVYYSTSGFLITGTTVTSDLTLDAQGNANAVWVFQAKSSSLTVGSAGYPRSVILINGAQAKNVFWVVGSSATINGTGGGIMVGTIIASSAVTFSTAGNTVQTVLDGRAVGLTASVTMVDTTINVPAP